MFNVILTGALLLQALHKNVGKERLECEATRLALYLNYLFKLCPRKTNNFFIINDTIMI